MLTPERDDPLADATFAGRIYLFLLALKKRGLATTDDAVLPGELEGMRQGNPSLVGRTTRYCHERGWAVPAPTDYPEVVKGTRSRRKKRKRTTILFWLRTPDTDDGLALIKAKLINRLRWKPRSLFDDLED